jgi:hypothetical protein
METECSVPGWEVPTTSHLLNVHDVNDVRLREIRTAEPWVPEPSAFEVEIAIKNLKSHWSPGIYQIPSQLATSGGRTICFEIPKLIYSLSHEELPEECKDSLIVPTNKKGDKTDCNNYIGISLLLTTYNILSKILLSRLTPYAEEIIGNHGCEF